MANIASEDATSQDAGHSSEKKERLSEILHRDTEAEDETPGVTKSNSLDMRLSVSCMKSRSSALLRRIVRRFQALHNRVRFDCQCKDRGSQQPKLIFRVVEPTRMKSGSRRGLAAGPGKSPVVRLATMNAALFSLAPALPGRFSCSLLHSSYASLDSFNPSITPPPPLASYLLEQPLSPPQSDPGTPSSFNSRHRCKLNPAFSPNPFYSFHSSPCPDFGTLGKNSRASILELLRDAKADLIALQEVKAEEEKGMAPLSDLADALGMHYAYAESWAPEFGNAVLSRWPVKSTVVTRIHDNTDCRNLLKVVVDVPSLGEISFCCTHLDHLDEDWRLKQVSSILEATKKQPHFLAGDLNSLAKSDYSEERWAEITKTRTECRKVAPRGDVMERLLVEKRYKDACTVAASPTLLEAAAAAVPRGQEVQGTCKYGTRIDYILASPLLPYSFVPGSYKVWPSRGTSDHHLITVDIRRSK